ncbi:MAG: class I SAM-dependent methyltransferase [Methanotrichaceae archaeon]|nr:class I SAM-dependent methyltransferase [Methanotrichaceae archaeon]
MLLNDILGIAEEDSVFLAEESWQDLTTLPVTQELLESGLEAEEAAVIGGKGIAFHLREPADFWLLLTDRYADQKVLQDRWPVTKDPEVRNLEASEDEFTAALAEYYATSLREELFCDGCQIDGPILYVEDRIVRLTGFLRDLIPPGQKILEIGCGNGMATQALLRLGHKPWSMDHDRCDLCQALKRGLMDPQRSLVLDARILPRIFPERSFDMVLGFMVGLIDSSNWPMWREVLQAASTLSRERLLFTTYSRKEADLIAKHFADRGFEGEVIDNRDSKGIYDQWAYLATRTD